MFSKGAGREPPGAHNSRMMRREMDEERAWFARKAAFFQETQARQLAARDQIVALLTDIGGALDAVANFVVANTEAAQAAKKRAGDLAVALEQATAFMSTGRYEGGTANDTNGEHGEEGGDSITLPPVLERKLRELEVRHERAMEEREQEVRSECDILLAEMREEQRKVELERDDFRKMLESERESAPTKLRDAVAAAVADTMAREVVVRERKVNEAVALAVSVERKMAASGMTLGNAGAARNRMHTEGIQRDRDGTVGDGRGGNIADEKIIPAMREDLKMARESIKNEKSARSLAEAEVVQLRGELKVAMQDLSVARQRTREKVRHLRSRIEELEMAAGERSDAEAQHDQTKREFRNFKRMAADKTKKAMEMLRQEHAEMVQSLRDEHRRMLNRAYQKHKLEKGKLEEKISHSSGNGSDGSSQSMTTLSNERRLHRTPSGPASKKHRVTGSDELIDVVILQRRLELEKKEKEKNKIKKVATDLATAQIPVVKRGQGKRGTRLVVEKEDDTNSGPAAHGSADQVLESTLSPQQTVYHKSKHSMVLEMVGEALDVGKDAISHPVGRRVLGSEGHESGSHGCEDTLSVDTLGGDCCGSQSSINSPGTPGGFSDCVNEGEVIDEDEGDELLMTGVLTTDNAVLEATKSKKKTQSKSKAKAAVKKGAKKMGTAAKKVGSAAKMKMGKLFGHHKKKTDETEKNGVAAPVLEETSFTPEVAPITRERKDTFDSLESKLSMLESLGDI